MTREELLNLFLKEQKLDTFEQIPLASDASSRSYIRLKKGNQTYMLMNSPISEHPDKFVFFDQILEKTGVHVPKIIAKDMENGFLLLEDFGDKTFTKLLEAGQNEYPLYKMGVDALIQLQKNLKLPSTGIDCYTLEQMLGGTLFLPNWFGKYALPKELPQKAIDEFKEIWTTLLKPLQDLPSTLTLLDYHVDNLMITSQGDCGLLDFQDARMAPVTYDLMSLLEDERREVSSSTREKLIQHYFKMRPEVDTPFVREMLPVIAMQRHTRVIGLFVRLFMRDQKEKYLRYIPFIWKLSEKHFSNPLFKDYKEWVQLYIPASIRQKVLTPGDFKCSKI